MYANIVYDVIYTVYLLFWHVDVIFYFANFTYVPYSILLHFQICMYIYMPKLLPIHAYIYIHIVCMYTYMMICAGCFYCMILAHFTYVWYSILLHLQTYVFIYICVCIIFHIATFTNLYILYIYICLNIYLYVHIYIYIVCMYLYMIICTGCIDCMMLGLLSTMTGLG